MQDWHKKYALVLLEEPKRCVISTATGQCTELADWQLAEKELPICYKHMNVQTKIFREEYRTELAALEQRIAKQLHQSV